MGYRNEIGIVILKEDYDKYFKNNEIIKSLLDYGTKGQIPETNYIVLHWDWIKWDEVYNEDAAEVMKILDKISEDGHPYAFVRLGEDDEDIEKTIECGEDEIWLDEYLYPVRYISYPSELQEI